MLRRFFGLFSDDLAIDLGTANTLVYVRGKDIVLNEPSVVAIREERRSKTILAVGQDAKMMLGRTPGNIRAIRPMKDGVIADFTVTEEMLKYFIRKAQDRPFFSSPRIIICVPSDSTQVERRAIRDSARGAGAREVHLIEEAIAVAIGANLPVAEPVGSMVLDVGGGTTEIGIISLGGLVHSRSLRVAGDSFDEAIINYVRHRHGVLIGDLIAEQVKKTVGAAWSQSEHREMEIRGRDVTAGLSRGFIITSGEVYEALNAPLTAIIQAIRLVLEQVPPTLSADIGDRGMVVAGGGALLRDLDQRLMHEVGMPVVIAEDPLTCVVRGCGRALENIDMLRDVFVGDE